MRRVYLGFLIVLIAFLNVIPAFAQEPPAKEPTVEDPFSDYSHLWEDSKKKKKKKKSKKSKEQVSLPQTMPVDSLPKLDSLNQQTDPKTETENIEQKPETQNVSTPASTPSNPPQQTADTPTDADQTATDVGKDLLESQLSNELPLDDFRKGLPFGGGKNSFEGGITYANIGGESYVGMSLSPEFKIGKVGVGLNVPILYGLDSKSFRTEIFKDGVGAARLVRYIRYGTQKQDPVYVKVGELNNLMIGYGSLINNYTNSTSYEKRKVGLHYDINFEGMAGIEGMYSDFDPSGLNLFVLRPYVRPFSKMPIPIVKTFEIGATFIKDKDQTKRPTSDSTFVTNAFTKPGIGAFGIDAGVTLLRVPFVQIDAFMSYAKLKTSSKVLTDSLTVIYNSTTNEPALLSDGFEDASGFSYGVNFRLHFIADVFSTDVRIERLTYGEHYLPQFFDATYELGKDSKILSLANASKTAGIYGSLSGHILQKVIIGGSLMIPDDVSETSPATVRVHADMERLADKFSLHGSYIKGGLSDLGDAFSFDDRSLAKLRVVYHLNKYLATGLDYYWAFAQVSDGSYKATKFVSPYFGLSVQF